jgi:hypothetical protein
MSVESADGPGWQRTNWHLRASEHSQTVPVDCYVTPTAYEQSDWQVHVYPGLGEGKWAVVSNALYLEHLGLPAVGVHAPFYRVAVRHREHLAREVPGVVADTIGNGQRVDLFGRSLGSLPVIIGGAAASDRIGSVAALGPASTTYEYMLKRPALRRLQFLGQLAILNMLMLEPDVGNIVQAGGMAYELSRYFGRRGLREAIDHGISPQVGRLTLESAAHIHDDQLPHRYYLPRRDGVFLAPLARRSLGRVGCGDCWTRVAGAHANGRTRLGKEQMKQYAAWVISMNHEIDTVPRASHPAPTV